MAFNNRTFCKNDWEFLDAAEPATFKPADSAGAKNTSYTVQVVLGTNNKPVAIGGRIALPGTHTSISFWKAEATNAPDPKPNDLIEIDGITYVMDSVVDSRQSRWDIGLTQTRTNTPAVS